MTVSLRLNEKDSALIKHYAEFNNISISDLFRNSVLEKIEDEYDLMVYEKAVAEYKADSKTYTVEQVGKMLGLD